MCCHPRTLALYLLALASCGAHAATVVTACGTDTAAGGTNLATALAAGGDIQIACAGAPNEIKLSATYALPNATTIDGGNVTLVGTGIAAMFKPAGAQPLALRNLTLRNAPTNPADPSIYTGVVYDATDTVVVELANVQVADMRLPFAVRRLVARDSTFTANGDAKVPDFGVVMAGDLELDGVTFRDNLSRPFHPLWRSDPTTSGKKISARVRNCTFERNHRPAAWVAGDLVIDNSRFTDNGAAAPYTTGPGGAVYGGQVFLEVAASVAGAVEIVLGRATISRSTFKSNRGMLGGAVFALGSSLTLQSTDLDGNKAVSGGAVAYVSLAAGNPFVARPRLALAHVKMHDNEAAKDGGAVFLMGTGSADALLISGSKAGESGGGLAFVGGSITVGEALPAAIVTNLPPMPAQPSAFELSRTFVLDNTAVNHAIDAGASTLRLGNTLVARNTSTAGGAALDAQNLELANSTIIGNKSEGLRIESGGAQGASLANVILAGNATNCTGAVAALKLIGANLQFPDAGCGAAMTVGDPSLDSRFAPTFTSAARNAGTLAICTTHDLVVGRDLYGEPRGGASCAIGAVESDVVRDGIKKVGPRFFPWLLLLILIFLLICLVIGLLIGLRRRHKKKKTIPTV